MTTADTVLLELLQHHHMPCPVCGYDLHRLTTLRCTECGKLLKLKVLPADPPLRSPWMALLAAGCINASVGLMALLITMIGFPRGTRRMLYPRGILFDIVYVVQFLLIPAPVAVLFLRRELLRWPQWVLVLVALAGTAWGVYALYGLATTVR